MEVGIGVSGVGGIGGGWWGHRGEHLGLYQPGEEEGTEGPLGRTGRDIPGLLTKLEARGLVCRARAKISSRHKLAALSMACDEDTFK